MRIAFYYPWIYLTSGGERIIMELARRSRHQWTLFTSHYEPENTFPEIRAHRVVELKPVSVKRDVLSTAKSALRILAQKLPLEEYDALFVLSEGLGDVILFRNHSRPSLCYCLTPLRAAFDPVYRAQSYSKRGWLGRLALSAGLGLFSAVDRLAWKHYTKTLFLSKEAVRRASQARLTAGQAPEILYTGVGLTADRPVDTCEPLFLIAGRIMWTKNIGLGIRAFQLFRARHPEFGHFRLVIAGMVDAKSRPYFAELQDLAGPGSHIEFVVSPSDAQLRSFYERCYAVLFTPLNEDLGIVPMEAMAFGKPVIAVNQGGPRETIQDGVDGFLVPPEPEAFAARMAELVSEPDLARTMGAQGFDHVQQFSWDRFVARIDDIFEEIAPLAQPGLPVRATESYVP